MRALLAFSLIAASAGAADVAVLASGARMQAVRIEREGDMLILHTGEGRIEIGADLVLAIESAPSNRAPVIETPPPAAAQVREPPRASLNPRELVTHAALRHGLPPALVHSVAMTESSYRPDAVSPKGAIGVMQLMPETARALDADPLDAGGNIDAGTRLLRGLLLKYQDGPDPVRRALAAYNAGEGAVDRYRGVPPYRETQAYVEKVIERYWRQVQPDIVPPGR
jgi:soluble lytic murein transglycosylase-like protein